MTQSTSVRRFVIVFALLFGALELVLRAPWLDAGMQTYLELNAMATGFVLSPFYADLWVDGVVVAGSEFSLSVARGCDASDPAAILLAGVVAYPATARQRLWGAGLGIALLVLLNVVRIASLFVIGSHWRAAFDVAHVEIWQGAFILASILMWMAWASWVGRRAPAGATHPTHEARTPPAA